MRQVWVIAAVLCALLTVAFTGLFLRAHYIPAQKAIDAGTRVEVNLKTGEIKQAPEKPAEEAKAAPAPAADKPAEKKEEAKDDKAAAAAAKPDEKAADKTADKDKPADKKSGDLKEPEEKAKEAKAAEPAPVAVEIPKGPKVAVIIVGAGLSRSSTEALFKLPAAVSFSFSPYAADLAQWASKATEGKHEIYVDVPMEPKDYPQTDPGPYALLTGLTDERNGERLGQIMQSVKGPRGLVSGPDEHFTENDHSANWLIAALKDKKLPLYYVARPENKQLTQEVEKSKLGAQGIDIVLDEKLTNEAIDAKLADAESLAQKSGFAVVLARPYPISAQRIDEWQKTLGPKGIHLVPLSQARAAP